MLRLFQQKLNRIYKFVKDKLIEMLKKHNASQLLFL